MRLIIFVLSVALLSCNYTDKKTTTDTPAVIESKSKEKAECYAWYSGRDTIELHVYINGDSVKGDLKYDFFEKDGSSGPINGSIKGDTLLADYEFNSEGTKSVRQVAFIKKAGDMIEGYGDAEEKNGRMVFKDVSALNYGATVLKSIKCGE